MTESEREPTSGPQPSATRTGRQAASAAPEGDVDPDADSLPDPEGHGPLSSGKDGQMFG
jgi:hypothetical protein